MGRSRGGGEPGDGDYYELGLPSLARSAVAAGRAGDWGAARLFVDGRGAGNEMGLINDFRGTGQARANAHYCGCWAGGWPVAVVVATAAVRRGEEVLVDYGDGWWGAAAAASDAGSDADSGDDSGDLDAAAGGGGSGGGGGGGGSGGGGSESMSWQGRGSGAWGKGRWREVVLKGGGE